MILCFVNVKPLFTKSDLGKNFNNYLTRFYLNCLIFVPNVYKENTHEELINEF